MAQLEWSYSWRIIKLGRSTRMEPQKSQPFPYATGCAVLETMVCWKRKVLSMQPSILKLTRHLKNRESRDHYLECLKIDRSHGIKPTSRSSSSPVLKHQSIVRKTFKSPSTSLSFYPISWKVVFLVSGDPQYQDIDTCYSHFLRVSRTPSLAKGELIHNAPWWCIF